MPATSASPGLFSGLWIPLITPFRRGAVDHAALHALTARLRGSGIAGFVACGSTGEAPALDPEEQLGVLDTVLQAARGLPVLMGVSGYHLPSMLAWVRLLGRRPIAGLLVPAPAYVRPAQQGLLHWFGAIADASSVPLVLYDIPARTGAHLATATLLALADHPRIAAVKDCGGDPAKTQAVVADGRLQVLAGDDAQIFATAALGGAGAIAASAHLHTAAFVRVLHEVAQGRLDPARSEWQRLLPLVDALFAEPNPAGFKFLLSRDGSLCNELRAPMTPASPALQQRLLSLEQTLSLP